MPLLLWSGNSDLAFTQLMQHHLVDDMDALISPLSSPEGGGGRACDIENEAEHGHQAAPQDG
eukprot:4730945-Prorocentrum_lima.AAC.1